MKYYDVKQTAKNWQLSERSVREYCHAGRIEGVKFENDGWKIPATADKPGRKNSKKRPLLKVLRAENKQSIKGGIYHRVQIDLTYNSNHIEGSRLTKEQTRYIFETNTIGLLTKKDHARADDVVETANHFRCIDYIIDNANRQINEHMIKRLHFILKNGTSDSREDWFAVGAYKKYPNEVGGHETTPPELVKEEMRKLIAGYRARSKSTKPMTLKDLLKFHYQFERIHPFQDGNGRVGRLILFKECLRLGITPFIIDEDLKMVYYRGLQEWPRQPGFLIETCRAGQDKFREVLEYYQIDTE